MCKASPIAAVMCTHKKLHTYKYHDYIRLTS